MKYLYLIAILFLPSFQSFAGAGRWFIPIETSSPKLKKIASQYQVLKIDNQAVLSFYNSDAPALELEIPYGATLLKLKFEQNNIHADDFKVLNAKGQTVNGLQYPHHYKSTTRARGKEMAALSVFSNGDLALVFSNSHGNLNLARLPDSLALSAGEYILFSDQHLSFKNPFQCNLDSKTREQELEEKKTESKQAVIQEDSACRLTEIYWECDHDMFTKGGNSVQGALNQFEAMFNGTAVLYEIENINIGVKAVKVWDTPDPYSYNSSFTALGDFQDAGNAANWPGQLAHLLSTRPLSLGGVAFLDAICTSFRYGFSNIDFLFQPLPVYSWTLSTIAHELGHNFSSNHTHNCNWLFPNGEVHQIDSCWNAEGDCQPAIKGRVGTIMSYCHLTGSVNLSLGFGPLPGDRIRQGYAEMPCVSGTIVIPNYTPVNSGPICDGDTLLLSAEPLSGFTYQWTGPNGFSATTREASVPNVTAAQAGAYFLSVKKASCVSRLKKTNAVFNCMQVGVLPSSFCAGSQISVPFTSTGVFQPENRFVLQLSSGAGSFSNPINLDTLYSATPQTMLVRLPLGLPLGIGYKVRFLSSSPAYVGLGPTKSFTISAMGSSPTPVDGSRCGPGSVSITANGGSNLTWYPTSSELLPLWFGRRFETPVINQTTSFFVQSGATSKVYAGIQSATGTSYDSTENGLVFNVLAGFRLDTISIRVKTTAGAATGSFQIWVRKLGTVLYSKTVNYSVGAGQSDVVLIPLYWRLDPGDDYQIGCSGGSFRLQKVPVVFPLKINGLLSIYSQISSPTVSEYPYFFKWVINQFTSCPSRRVEVKALVTSGITPPTANVSLAPSPDSVVSSSQGIGYEWLINGQLYTNLGPKVKGNTNFVYRVRYRVDSCWSEWSEPFLYTLLSVEEAANTPVSVYPNPANGRLFWLGPQENTTITMYNTAGKHIWEKQVSGKESIDISLLADGLYWIRWKSGHSAGVVRFIKN